jgi:hypothetical protein
MLKTFQQPVMAQDLESAHLSHFAQPDAVVLFVFHEGRLVRGQLLQHSRYESGRDSQMFRERIAVDR